MWRDMPDGTWRGSAQSVLHRETQRFGSLDALFFFLKDQTFNISSLVNEQRAATKWLVGVVLGRFRFSRGMTRLIALPIGWGLAILLHVAFNRTLSQSGGFNIQIMAVSIGLAGIILTAAFIFRGLRPERAWLREALGMAVGVSAGESAMVQELADLALLSAPVGECFGRQKQMQVERFLRLQARLGLKRKAHAWPLQQPNSHIILTSDK